MKSIEYMKQDEDIVEGVTYRVACPTFNVGVID